MRAWAEDLAARRVLEPLEQAMPEATLASGLPARRSSTRASFSAAADGGCTGASADLGSRVSRLASACRAVAARTQELEAALKM